MMTAGWFFSPLWMGILSLLILISSVSSSVPVLQISGSPYNEVVLPPSLDALRYFFHDVP
jgi:hypothetical protein